MSKKSVRSLRGRITEWIAIIIAGLSVAFAGYQAGIAKNSWHDAKSASDKQYQLALREADQAATRFQRERDFERKQAEKTLELARSNLVEAQRSLSNQIKALRLTERPYVTASSAYVDPYLHRVFVVAAGETIHEDIPGAFHVRLQAQGSSPARNIRLFYSCRSGVWHSSHNMKVDDDVRIENGDLAPVVTLAPQSSYEFTCYPNDGEGTPKDVRFSTPAPVDLWQRDSLIISHAGSIVISGKIVYSDIFNEHHETNFCFQNRGNYDRGGQLDFCGKGNEAF